MRQLEAVGWKCVHDPAEPKGEVCVINTCGFIGDAKEESINMILQMAERKKKGKLKKLIVMGCLSERYRAELEEELPEVDEYYGKFDFENLTLSLSRQRGGSKVYQENWYAEIYCGSDVGVGACIWIGKGIYAMRA